MKEKIIQFLKNKFVYPTTLAVCFILVFGFGIWIGAEKVAYYVQEPDTINFSLFWDTYNKLQQNFINPENINDEEIIYGAIKGMTKSLGDPYTSFFDPTEAKKFEDDLLGSFEGIGVEIGIKKDLLTVVAPLKNTPGQKAGLKSGDVIIGIDGKSTVDMTTDDAVNLIRGKKGTNVVLTIYRDDWTETQDITITRDTIEIPAMDWKIINNNIAYIQIYQFDASLLNNFKIASNKILESNVEKIVLDLRDNPGGYLEVAQKIAGYFIKSGEIVVIEDFGATRGQEVYKTNGDYSLEKYPIVVLINEGSASASEILAGALRDDRNIQLIGEKSFGKGSVQEIITLRGGSYLKITIAKWLTPKGVSISEVGLEPDIKIEITNEDIKAEKDTQLEKALEIISNLK
jgi:carboxyl-terminal processing protease